MKWKGMIRGMIILYIFLVMTIECKTSAVLPEPTKQVFSHQLQESENHTPNTEEALTKASIDDKIEKSIKIFIGDLDKGQIVYEDYIRDQDDKEEDIAFLTRILKLDSQKSGTYIKAIPHLGAIKAIDRDLKQNTVYINMTKAYDLKSYGSLAEYLALQSLGSTVACYYKADKAVIYIDGQPYRSGHYTFEKNQEIELVQLNQ